MDLGRRGRPNAQASVGFVPGAKARSAHQSRGLASLVRVTWCFDCSPHGSAGSTGHAEAVVGFTCPKPAGRRCWVATAGDCTYVQVSRISVVGLTYLAKSSLSVAVLRSTHDKCVRITKPHRSAKWLQHTSTVFGVICQKADFRTFLPWSVHSAWHRL